MKIKKGENKMNKKYCKNKITKKYIASCYDCDKSVGGSYPEQDLEVSKLLEDAMVEVDKQLHSGFFLKNGRKISRKNLIISHAYESQKNKF